MGAESQVHPGSLDNRGRFDPHLFDSDRFLILSKTDFASFGP